MAGKEDEVERRVELAAKVQILEERTNSINKSVERIETTLNNHTKEEEIAFHSFYKTKVEMIEMISNFKDAISEKLDETVNKVEEQLEPIRDDFRQVKTVYKVLTIIGGALIAVAVFFKDYILSHFTHL